MATFAVPASLIGVLLAASALSGCVREPTVPARPEAVTLPPSRPLSSMTIDDALGARRSVRSFTPGRLAPEMVGRLLWAAQGVTSADGRRTAPSAGALYPLDLYAVTADGVSRYRAASHDLEPVTMRDLRDGLRSAALGQEAVAEAALVIVIVGDYARAAGRYGYERGERYVILEAGHVAQNILLEAVALGLGAVPIGAFDDEAVGRVVGLPGSLTPLYLVAVGRL